MKSHSLVANHVVNSRRSAAGWAGEYWKIVGLQGRPFVQLVCEMPPLAEIILELMPLHGGHQDSTPASLLRRQVRSRGMALGVETIEAGSHIDGIVRIAFLGRASARPVLRWGSKAGCGRNGNCTKLRSTAMPSECVEDEEIYLAANSSFLFRFG